MSNCINICCVCETKAKIYEIREKINEFAGAALSGEQKEKNRSLKSLMVSYNRRCTELSLGSHKEQGSLHSQFWVRFEIVGDFVLPWNYLNLLLTCRCQRWVENCRRADLEDKTPDQLNKHYRLCAKHFETSMICRSVSKTKHFFIASCKMWLMFFLRVPHFNLWSSGYSGINFLVLIEIVVVVQGTARTHRCWHKGWGGN